MNKRSAMLMAAGLVLTMIIAGIAISAGLTGLSTSAAAPRVIQPRTHKPIVKTVRTTRTVHKKAPQAPVAPRSMGVSSTTAPVPVSVGYARPTWSGTYVDDGGYDDAGGPTPGRSDD